MATRELGLYRLAWGPERPLAWVLSYDGQEWASICAYLPGRPQMHEQAAREWAESLVGPLTWRPDGTAQPAGRTGGQAAPELTVDEIRDRITNPN
ncbi:hypothetical protein ACFVAF_25405 [Streptomyces sp. NPDC057596]|uniref:hypothetical protein n=1 Tax=Streptomyces sp. NPDC057596 TaxID=3346178 RepID=UPI00368E0470